MNKYVVAFISFHDNILTQEIIEADSDVLAIKQKMNTAMYRDEDTIEDLKSLAFDYDCMVSAYKI